MLGVGLKKSGLHTRTKFTIKLPPPPPVFKTLLQIKKNLTNLVIKITTMIVDYYNS